MNSKLIEKVAEQLGYEEANGQEFIDDCENVSNHGADGGFSGFIYTTDTVAFFKQNKRLIMDEAKEIADNIGQGLFEMIAGFNCLDDVTAEDVAEAIYTGKGEMSDSIQSALAWFALEEVSRYVSDNKRKFEKQEEVSL